MDVQVSWQSLMDEIKSCEKCGLCKTRTHTVPGEGSPNARLMLIGEGPGRDEDLTGRPFVGAAGQLLTKMLEAIQIKRGDAYICNVVKCRPPGNRNPMPEECAACLPYLRAQVALVRPQVIVLLGKIAVRETIDPQVRITKDRGVWAHKKGIWMMPTFHPAALLRDESMKRPAWQDFKAVRDKLLELEGQNEE